MSCVSSVVLLHFVVRFPLSVRFLFVARFLVVARFVFVARVSSFSCGPSFSCCSSFAHSCSFYILGTDIATPSYAIGFYLPEIIRQAGYDDLVTINLLIVPVYLLSAIGIVVGSWLADRTGNRFLFVIGPATLSGVGLVILAVGNHVGSFGVQYFAMFVAGASGACLVPVMISWMTDKIRGSTRTPVAHAMIVGTRGRATGERDGREGQERKGLGAGARDGSERTGRGTGTGASGAGHRRPRPSRSPARPRHPPSPARPQPRARPPALPLPRASAAHAPGGAAAAR